MNWTPRVRRSPGADPRTARTRRRSSRGSLPPRRCGAERAAAALMAQAVRDGHRVVCVTATRGEEGSWDEERWPTSEMGRVREAELMASLGVLGVTEHIWLDYYDGTCSQVDPKEGAERVRQIVATVQPRSVF